MDNQTQLLQALHLTVNELTTKYTNEMLAKNLLATQLTEAEQTIAALQEQVAKLSAQLETQNEEKGE